jgi:hypothetical protein
VRAGKDGQTNHIGVFLQSGADNLLRCLAKARIDYLHAGVPERASDDLGAAVVAVETRLGNDNSDFLAHFFTAG